MVVVLGPATGQNPDAMKAGGSWSDNHTGDHVDRWRAEIETCSEEEILLGANLPARHALVQVGRRFLQHTDSKSDCAARAAGGHEQTRSVGGDIQQLCVLVTCHHWIDRERGEEHLVVVHLHLVLCPVHALTHATYPSLEQLPVRASV